MPEFDYTPYWYQRVSTFKELAGRTYSRPIIAMLGDSLTEGFPFDEFFPQYSFANRGISGDVTKAALDRLNESILSIHPDRVGILLGTNDLAFGYSDDEILAAMQEILHRIRTQVPSAVVAVQSVLPTRDDPTRPNPRIRELNRELEPLTRSFGCAWIDLHPAFADPTGQLSPAFSLDGLHLNGPGYRRWAELLDPWLTQP